MFKFGIITSALGSGRRYKNASSHSSSGGASARRSSTYSADPFGPDCLDDAGKTGEPAQAPATARGVEKIAPASLFSAPAAEANAAGTAAAAKVPAKAAAKTPPAKRAKAASTKHPVTVVFGTSAGSASSVLARAGKKARPREDSSGTESDTSHEDLPLQPACKRGQNGPKNKQQALREYVVNQPAFQTLTQHIPKEKAEELLAIGLRFQGQGLEIFFDDGPFLDFCETIALFNGSSKSIVKKSKLKMLKTWTNRNNEYYDYLGGPRPQVLVVRDMGNIVLTVKGKHNLLMHIDTEEERLAHSLENMCRNAASDVMTKLFEFSRSLPSQVETVNKYLNKRNATHEKSKQQMREQIKILEERQGLNSGQAHRSLQGDAQFLYRGLFPEKKDRDGETILRKDETPVTFTAAEMVMKANPQIKSKQQVYSRSIMAFANEPIIHATLLQRTAVTARMNRGEDHRTAHKEVGKSKGINLALLFGIPEDDVDQLADLSFNKTKGIELFGREQPLLQIEAGADAGGGGGGGDDDDDEGGGEGSGLSSLRRKRSHCLLDDYDDLDESSSDTSSSASLELSPSMLQTKKKQRPNQVMPHSYSPLAAGTSRRAHGKTPVSVHAAALKAGAVAKATEPPPEEEEDEEELSAYEKERLAKIKRNNAFLLNLGIHTLQAPVTPPRHGAEPRAPDKGKEEEEWTPVLMIDKNDWLGIVRAGEPTFEHVAKYLRSEEGTVWREKHNITTVATAKELVDW